MSADQQMTIWEHIGELRRRLIHIVLVLIVGTGVGLAVTPRILTWMLAPYGNQLKVISPTEGIASYLRVGLICGFVLALPVIILEVWGFIAPGLMKREKRYVYTIIPAALLLFLGGASFAWFLLIPAAVRFLATFNLGIFKTEWTSQSYVPFVTSLVFWIGVCFELPLAVFVLAKLHVVTARLLLKGWRYAVVLICIVAAVITPTVDPFNMMLVAVPLIALYFASILLAVIAGGGKRGEKSPSEPA